MRDKLLYVGAAALLLLIGWSLGYQETSDAQLLPSGGRWTIQSAGPQSGLIFMYNTSTGEAYQILFGPSCDHYPLGNDACLVPVRYREQSN